jgi:hypothetical protein
VRDTEAFEGQCETIAVRDGVPRPGERCELPAHDNDVPHVFPTPNEAVTTLRCPIGDPERPAAQCELTAGHDEGPKATPHMIDRGEGVPPLTWWDSSVAAPVDEAATPEEAWDKSTAVDPKAWEEAKMFDPTVEPPPGKVFTTSSPAVTAPGDPVGDSRSPSAVAFEYLEPYLDESGDITKDALRGHVQEAVALALQRAGQMRPLEHMVNPPEAPAALLEAGHDAVVVPFISARMNNTGRRLQAQLVERPEIVVAADSIPELHDALWDALQGLLAFGMLEGRAAWRIEYEYDLWSGRSQVEQTVTGLFVVLGDGSIDRALEAIAARLDGDVGERAQRERACDVRAAVGRGDLRVSRVPRAQARREAARDQGRAGMSVNVQARRVAPGDVIARRRPARVGGGFVPGEVRETCPVRDRDGMVELVGDGWSWALPSRQLVVRIAGRR